MEDNITDTLINSIRDKYTTNPTTPKNSVKQPNGLISLVPSGDNRPLLQDVETKVSLSREVPVAEAYTNVAGDWMKNFPTFKQGRDNAEYAAQTQTTSDKLINGLTKATVNFGATIIGNTVGRIVYLTQWAKEGSFDAVYDNSFSNYIADLNQKLDYQLPNYISKDEADDNFFQSLGNANFWAKDVAGAFSFILGTAVSEGIWAWATGGASLGARAGQLGARLGNVSRWGKTALGAEKTALALAKNKGIFYNGIENLYKTGKISKGLANTFSTVGKSANTLRFIATSSGNEAGIEALHYKREAEENFYRNFESLNGYQPTEQDIAEFKENLDNSANAIFATNMAILAPSNMAMFGSMFNISSPLKGISKNINKNIFNVGVEKTVTETGQTIYKGLEKNLKSQILSTTYAGVKPLITEGLWEEGLQGVTTKTAENWIESTYNPKYGNETMAIADAMYKGFAEQYGTKEGWKEIGIGAIVGAGSSLVIGKGYFQEVRQMNQERAYQEKYVAKGLNQFGEQNPLVTDITTRRIMMNSRVQDAVKRAKESAKKGDDVSAYLSQQDILLAEMQFRDSIGEDVKDLIKKYSTSLNSMTEDDYKDAGIENIEEHKEQVLNGLNTLVNSYNSAKKFSDSIFGDTPILGQKIATQQLKDALRYSIVKGELSNKAMDSSLEDLSKVVGADNVKALRIKEVLQRQGRNKQAQVNNLNKKIKLLEQTQEKLTKQVLNIQAEPQREEGNKLGEVNLKLTEVVSQLEALKQERQDFARELSEEETRRKNINANLVDTDFNTDSITGNDLSNVDEKLTNIENILKSYKGMNHQMYFDAIEAIGHFKSAKDNFLNYQKSIDSIVNGELNLKFQNVGGLLGKVFNPKAELDNFSSEYLETIYNNYKEGRTKSSIESEILESNVVSDEDYKNFKETGDVLQEVLNTIATKVGNKTQLTEREKEIFKSKEDEINVILNTNVNKPNLNKETKQVEIKTDTEDLRERINKLFNEKYYNLTYLGEDIDEQIKNKPSKSEIEKYKNLFENKKNLNQEELKELTNLKVKLTDWFVLDSLMDENESIADLIELQIQLDTQVEQQDTVDEIVEEDLQIIFNDEIKITGDVFDPSLGINTNYTPTVKLVNNGTSIRFHHIKVGTLITKLNPNKVVVKREGKEDLFNPSLETLNNLEGNNTIVLDNNNVTINLEPGGRVVMNYYLFKSLQNVLNMFTSVEVNKYNNWSYHPLYEFNGQEFVPMTSDFNDNTINGNTFELEEGDTLQFFVDVNNDYNIKLLNKYNNKEIDEKELENQVGIYWRKNGDDYQTTKAQRPNDVNEKLATLRKIAGETLLNGESRAIAESEINYIHLGLPSLTLNENNTTSNIDFTERATEEVITTGYIENNVINLANKTIEDKVKTSFISNFSKNKENLKVPLVVFKRGKQLIAYPISMKKYNNSKLNEFQNILNNSLLNEIDKVKAINSLLIENNISPKEYNLVDLKKSVEKLDRIGQRLSEIKSFETASTLSNPNYNKVNLINDAEINIDLENLTKVLPSQKVSIDFDNITYLDIKRDVKYETMNDYENRLSDITIQINSFLSGRTGQESDYRDVKGNQIEDNFREVFDDNEVYKNPINQLQKQADVKTISNALEKNTNNISRFVGKELIKETRNLINKYNFIKSQIKVENVDKKTEEELGC